MLYERLCTRVRKGQSRLPKFHKLAVAEIARGEAVYKYGEVMGVASRDIHVGQWAHIHNIDSTRGRGDKAGKEREA